ncbi:MAG: O-antigen ligase family protein [Cyanothece sp. SIO1E1]|nr:O-antigen ligase family protein [Cyanothece sp. SIO1E1]
MEPTKLTVLKANESSKFRAKLLEFSLVSLPFVSYAGLAGLVILIVLTLKQQGALVFKILRRRGLLIISVLLLINSLFAFYKGEAFLQLTNFLPFFLLFAVLTILLKSAEQLEQLMLALATTSIPINLIAIFEYWLKFPSVAESLSNRSILAWFYRHDYGHRANSVFGHPNVLANFLVLILGFELGLILKSSLQQPSRQTLGVRNETQKPLISRNAFLYLTLFLNLVGLFCSASRNGFLIAISELIIFGLFARKSRIVLYTFVSGLAIILGTLFLFGVGGRQISITDLVSDPRVETWQIAVELIQKRPLTGWGLGNYKLMHPLLSSDPLTYIAHPHNLWLLLAAETGIPILVALTTVIGFICYRGVKSFLLTPRNQLDRGIMLSCLLAFWSCTTFSLADVTFYDARLNAINWLALAGIYKLSMTPELSSAKST